MNVLCIHIYAHVNRVYSVDKLTASIHQYTVACSVNKQASKHACKNVSQVSQPTNRPTDQPTSQPVKATPPEQH